MRTWPLALALPLIGGCFGSAFDGTWLFNFDPEPVSTEGTCVGQGEDTVSSTGTSYDMVDMFTNDANGIVVLLEMVLTGTVDGKQFQADAIEDNGAADWYWSEGVTMDGTRDGKVLSGRINSWWEYQYYGDPEDCETTWSYTAERIDSDPEGYAAEEL